MCINIIILNKKYYLILFILYHIWKYQVIKVKVNIITITKISTYRIDK